MKIQRRPHGAANIVDLSGDLDFHAASEFRNQVTEFAAETQAFVLNFKQVGYVDSSGIAAIMELFQRMKRQGGKLVLCHLSDEVRGVFKMAKLDMLLTLTGSEKEALEKIAR